MGHTEEPTAELAALRFSVAADFEKEKLAAVCINDGGEFNHPALGMPNSSAECLSCKSTDLKSCEGHFGVIHLPLTVLHPFFLAELVKVLNAICPSCKSRRGDTSAPEKCVYCTAAYPRIKFKLYSHELYGSVIIAELRANPDAPKSPSDYWNIIPRDPIDGWKVLNPNSRLLSPAQVHHLLKNVDHTHIKAFVLQDASLFVNFHPISPNSHRVTEFFPSFSSNPKLMLDKRYRPVKKLAGYDESPNEVNSLVRDCLKASKVSSSGFNTSANRKNDETLTGLGWIKNSVLSKRNDHSFRAVVVGDPRLRLDEIGIPSQIAKRLTVSEQWNQYNKGKLLVDQSIRVRRNREFIPVEELRVGDVIDRPLRDGDKILVNRPPSIHMHSLIALNAKVISHAPVVTINPLCCVPFSADFDGDCIHGYVSQSLDARIELDELVALDKQLINSQNGKNLLSLKEDSSTAMYLVLEDRVVFEKHERQQMEMICDSFAPLIHSDLWTGKHFANLLSKGICQNEILNDELFFRDGNEKRFSLSHFYEAFLKSKSFLVFLQSAQEALCEWLSMRGFSVSLLDLYLCNNSKSRERMLEEIRCGLKESDQICNLKQMMLTRCEKFRSDDFSQLSFDEEKMCFEKQSSISLTKALVKSLQPIYQDIHGLYNVYATRENSLATMYRAGSMGNLAKLVQHSFCLGLQHSFRLLNFRVPRVLSCKSWNRLKSEREEHTMSVQRFVPSAVIENSFLTGLNPLECLIHSSASREGSFSDNAEVPGSLNRKLMFFLRDIYWAYDGTVRNFHNNQIVQFSYGDLNCVGGHPVGSLAACAVSEAGYSALEQPGWLDHSWLLKLKNSVDCGSKRSKEIQTATLYLSPKLGRRRYGYEYGSLEVQKFLEGLSLSDVVSSVRIMYSNHDDGVTFNPWVCHFYIRKEIYCRIKLSANSVVNIFRRKLHSMELVPAAVDLKRCEDHENDAYCLTVSITTSSDLEAIKNEVIPTILETVVRGFKEIKKVDIIWSDKKTSPKLRVSISKKFNSKSLWKLLLNYCLQITELIDWERSHSDRVTHFSDLFGIDSASTLFLLNLDAAVAGIGKPILNEHVSLIANSLSVTGNFTPLNFRGLKDSLLPSSSPFLQACFTNPGKFFVQAAKDESVDSLRGALEALAWGRPPALGTGHFDVVYTKKSESPEEFHLYDVLENKTWTRSLPSYGTESPIAYEVAVDNLQEMVRLSNGEAASCQRISYDDVAHVSMSLGKMLRKYSTNCALNETDKAMVMKALYFHPNKGKKMGSGIKDITVMRRKGGRCFCAVRVDGSVVDFSYHKCVFAALRIVFPRQAMKYHSKNFGNRL